MVTFAARRHVAAPARTVWNALTDWPSHGRWMPLTTVTVTHDAGGLGTRFVGRTGVGRLGFDDPMEVIRWDPPEEGRTGTCTLRKTGNVVLGWAQLTVEPLGPHGCRVIWAEDVEIPPTRWTRWASPLVALAGRALFGAMLWQADRQVTRG